MPLNYDEKRMVTHKSIQLDVRMGERAFIKSIALVYASNETNDEIQCKIGGLMCDPVEFTIPAGVSCQPSERDALLYIPAVQREYPNFPYGRYLGCESAITECRSSAVMTTNIQAPYVESDFDVFADGDPLIVFLFENRHFFKTIQAHHIVLLKDETMDKRRCYAIHKSVTRLVASWFERQIASKLIYEVGPSVMIELDAPCLVVVAIDYVLITPHVPVMKTFTYGMKP